MPLEETPGQDDDDEQRCQVTNPRRQVPRPPPTPIDDAHKDRIGGQEPPDPEPEIVKKMRHGTRFFAAVPGSGRSFGGSAGPHTTFRDDE